MTATPNQPNRGNQSNPGGASRTGSGTSQQDPQAQSKPGPSRDEGTRFGSAALQQAFSGAGDDAARCLDAIQENVNKLRIAMGGSGRSGVAERESRSGRSDRSDSSNRQGASSDEDRSETSGNL